MASMGLMVKSAAEEQANIGRLSIALKNVGVSYDQVKDSLEGVISATQKKTGIADSEQRDVLGRLLLVTNDYNKALKLLPLTLDLAAAGQMDASTAATYLGKAMLDLEGGAKKVTVRLGQASMQFSSLAEIEERVGGAAEAAANPFTVLGAEIGDLGEEIGKVLLPIIKDLIGKFMDIIGKIKDWVEANPQLVKAIAAGALAVAGLITALFAAKAAVILLGSAVNLYFGGILILIGAVVTGIVLLVQNWSKITNLFASSAKKLEQSAKEMTVAIKAELEKQEVAALETYTTQKTAAQSLYDANIKKIREEYGELKTESKNKMDLARDASDAARRALDSELKHAEQVHNEKMNLLQREYDQKLKTLNAEADAQISAIQSQIDAIERQTEQEDLYLTRQAEQQRLATLTGVERTQYAEEIARNEVLRTREAQKNALRAQIDEIRTATQTETDRLSTELEANQTQENALWELFQTNQTLKAEALDGALEAELKRLNEEGLAKLQLEEDALTATIERLAAEEAAIKDSYARRLTEAALHQAALKAIEEGKTPATSTGPVFQQGGFIGPSKGFQHGGIIPEPTLLYGLKSRRPYAIAGEAGPERVVPSGGGYQTANIIIQLDGRTLAQAIGQPLVDTIRVRTGVRI